MYPSVYRSSAIFIAWAAVSPLFEASSRNTVVLNGGGGYSDFSSCLTSLTRASLARLAFATASRAASLTSNLPCLWDALKSFSFLRSAVTSQYGVGTNSWISFSLATMSASVGVWTLPTDRKSLPRCPEANDMNRVREAPHARSMYCLVSAAVASL